MNAQTAFLVTCESIWPPNESLHTNWHFSKLALTSMALIFPLLLSIDSNAVYSYLREELRQWWPWHFHDTKITHTSHAIADSDPDTIFFSGIFLRCLIWTVSRPVLPSRAPQRHWALAIWVCEVARAKIWSFVPSPPRWAARRQRQLWDGCIQWKENAPEKWQALRKKQHTEWRISGSTNWLRR